MKARGGEANLNLLFAKCEFNEKRIFEIRPKLSLSKISMLDTSMTGKANYPFILCAVSYKKLLNKTVKKKKEWML